MTNEDLFIQQKELLDTFLSTGAITKKQYDISFNGLIQKMKLDKKDIERILNSNKKGAVKKLKNS